MAGSKAPGRSESLAPPVTNTPSFLRIYTLVGVLVIVWTLQFIVAKQALREIPPLALSGLRTALTVVGTTGFTINQIFYALAVKYTSVGHSSLIMAATYTEVAGGAVGYRIYFWALGYLSSSRLSMYAYVKPILATLAAFVLLDELITLTMWAAGTLVVAGVWISGRRA